MQLDPITRAVLDAMQEGVLIIDAQVVNQMLLCYNTGRTEGGGRRAA